MKLKKIKLKDQEIEVEVCNTILSKARGLMFRKNPQPLLFIFNHPTRTSIHSFFCKPFKAIWLLNHKIVDEKIVDRWRFSIRSKGKFDELVEIPLKNNNR